MASLRRIIAEVHRRSLWQVLSIYLVGAWLAYQVILGLTDGIGLPDWVPGLAFVLFLVGLPIVLATAFVNEGAPTLRREEPTADGWDETLLPGLAQDGGPAGGAGEPRAAGQGDVATAGHWLTWRRSLGAGLLAFVVLGAGTTGFMGMRVFGIGPAGTLLARQVLEQDDAVLLADFSSSADPGLATVVAEALRIDLMQTRVFRLVDPAHVREGLRMMQHDATSGMADSVALQLAQRQGWKAVLAGDVSTLGGSYILSARLLSAGDGEVLAAFREVARDSTRLIDAVDALGRQIRAKAGESLRTVRTSEPLWKVSTSSLAALRLYSEAERVVATTGDAVRAVALLEEAVAEDPQFASAYRKIGILLGNVGLRRQDRLDAVRKAYELRDRLTERERLYAIGSYHLTITNDAEAAVDALRAVLAIDPDDETATNNITIGLSRLGRIEEGVDILQRAVARPTASNSHFLNLASGQYALGRTEDARRTVEEGIRRMPDNLVLLRLEPRLHAAAGDFVAAEAGIRRLMETMPPNSTRAAPLHLELADVLMATGRLAEAEHVAERLRRMADDAGMAAEAFSAELSPIAARMVHFGEREQALREIRALLRRSPLEAMPPADRPYLLVASDLATAGDFDGAAALLDAYERELPPEDRAGQALARTRVRVALLSAPSEDLIREIRRLEPPNCRICILADLGAAYEALGQPDSAMAAYQRYLETPHLWRTGEDAWNLGRVLIRLGELHENRGDRQQALSHYARLLDLWKDADPEFRPQLDAVRARVRALSQEGRG